MDEQAPGRLADADESPLRDLVGRIPALAGRPCRVAELPGGLTNRNYRVVAPGCDYVVRVFGNEPELPIDRDHEYRNSTAAAASGAGAPVIDYLPEHGMLVVGYIDGLTLSDSLVRRAANIPRVAAACRRLHRGPRFGNDFDMAAVQDRYLTTVRERGFRLPQGYSDAMDAYVRRVREVLEATGDGVSVPCNNDLLAENFIDDGEHIRIIDYEYAGNNDPCFELGNIWAECRLSVEELELLVTSYYGRPRPAKVARAQLQGLMSKYGWTLWASIQEATSSIEFDFWSWGLEKYDSAIGICRDTRRFERLLEDVQSED